MLGSLARKLRASGFDAVYYREGDDLGLIRAAKRDGLVILTSDRGLRDRGAKEGLFALLVSGKDDRARLRSVAKEARNCGVDLTGGDPLCSVCGSELAPLRRAEVRGTVPRSVERRHREFFRCSSCGKLYWKGGHWKKLRSLSRLLRQTNANL